MTLGTDFGIGSRVVVVGLKGDASLNGKHGTVASELDQVSGRYAIDLDLLPTSRGSRIKIRPGNVLPEAPLPAQRQLDRAGCQEGILVEEHGRPLSHLLDMVRYVMSRVFRQDQGIESVSDIEALRAIGPPGLMSLNQLIGMAWSHWLEPGGFQGTGGAGVYGHLVKYMTLDLFPDEEKSQWYGNLVQRRLRQALENSAAVGGWHNRVHGAFWVVGEDEEHGSGTFVIPQANPNAVYKVLGIRSSLLSLVRRSFGNRTVKMVMTLVPWYGRLVYDGVIHAATPDGRPGPPPVASQVMETKMRETVELAKQQGRVIDRLLALEVEGAQALVPDVSAFLARAAAGEGYANTTPDQAALPQPEPSPQERDLMDTLKMQTCGVENAAETFWVMRRMGYTEMENPNHIGIVMAGSSPIGSFHCSQGIAPVSTDILTSLLETCGSHGDMQLPRYLNIDEEACFHRVKYLFEKWDMDSITSVHYYAPPTAEETRAAMNMPQ